MGIVPGEAAVRWRMLLSELSVSSLRWLLQFLFFPLATSRN